MSDYKSIVVKDGLPVLVVHNPTRYSLIGRGGNGAVFQLSEDRCVKIYPNESFARAESEALRIGQASPVFPKVYKSGRKYVVMEYIKGILLEEHLREVGVISERLTEQILFVIKELKRLGFSRQDARLRHLILTKEGNLKVIDHVNSLSKKYDYPESLLKGLNELGLMPEFLQQVNGRNPELYRKWKSKLMNNGVIQPSKKICFAVLMHNNREVVQDMLDNIRVHCPNSAIVLFNGGLDPNLCKNLGYPVCPTSRKLEYGVTAIYLLEVMEWLEQLDFPYDYLINLDSDALFLRNGYETFIEETMRDSEYMGVDVFIRDKNWICGKHLEKEWDVWKTLLLSKTFLGAFNVGQVFSRQFVKQLLSWEEFGRLKNNLLHTKAFGVDEIVYVMIAKRFGLKLKSYPIETGKAVRYRPHYKYQEIIKYTNKNPHSYLLHPVKRKINDEARTLVRDLTRKAWSKQLFSLKSSFSEMIPDAQDMNGRPEILRNGNKLEMVAPLLQGGFGFWRHTREKDNSVWLGALKFGKRKWSAFSMIRSGYGNLEIIARKGDRLIHFWHDEKKTMWNKTQYFANGVCGIPYFTKNKKGNFQVIAPLIKGGFGLWWRNNGHLRKPWYGPAIIGKRKMDVVSLFNTDNKRIVAVVASNGRLLSYIGHNGRWKLGAGH